MPKFDNASDTFDPNVEPSKYLKSTGSFGDVSLEKSQKATQNYKDSLAYQQANSQAAGGQGTNYLENKRPSGYKKYTHGNFTPAQMELFNQAFAHVGPESYLSKLAMGDESQFAAMEAPALRQFNQLQGNLASRFSGQGMGARGSSGFQNASNAAAQDFASQLQANRQGLQRQAVLDLMGMTSSLLGAQPYSQGYAAKGQKGGVAGGYGQPAGTFLGAMADAYTGGSSGGAFTAGGSALGSMLD